MYNWGKFKVKYKVDSFQRLFHYCTEFEKSSKLLLFITYDWLIGLDLGRIF